ASSRVRRRRMSQPGLVLVAIHGGAGYHSEESDTEVRKAMKIACKYALARLHNACKAIDAIEDSIVVLEDDQSLNAGFGSNLTVDGTVECDASISDGRTGDFGSVGAVAGINNPIRAARAVLDHSRESDSLGRIRPTMLVSSGARAFAEERGVPCVSPDSLVCERARAEWTMWKACLDSVSGGIHAADDTVADKGDLHRLQDTVGAVAWDCHADLAAGVSSGGLLLKCPGRVGEAAVYGAGCWAQQSAETSTGVGIACSVSGSGEFIIREMLARRICEAIIESPDNDVHEILHYWLSGFQSGYSKYCPPTVVNQRTTERCRARGESDPIAGVLLLVKEVDDGGETRREYSLEHTQHDDP
ncbi:uncharacterized protein PHACADRAFT_96391, partial [Phanerochaete carnosa HHB-10118-sp]